MYLYLLNTVPTVVFIISIIFLIDIIVISVFFIVKKFVPINFMEDVRQFRSPLIGLVTGSYGILLGFLIVSLWDWHIKATECTAKEAAAVATLTYASLTFPPSVQQNALESIGEYVKAVVQDEWPLQHYEKQSILAHEALENLFRSFHSYVPLSETGISDSRAFMFILNDIVEFRSIRLSKLHSLITSPFYFVLFFGIILITFIFSLYRTRHHHFHLIALLIFTSILSLNIGLIIVLDRPYSGRIAVSDAPFKKGVLARFNAEPSNDN